MNRSLKIPELKSRRRHFAALAVPAFLFVAADTLSSGALASPGDGLAETAKDALSSGLNKIDGLQVTELDDGTTILHVMGSSKPTFNVYRLSDPDRLVVDVSSSARGKAVPHVSVDTWAVGRVAISSVDERNVKSARIVVDLKREASYIVVPKGNELIVTVTPREVPPEAYFARKSAGKRRAEIAKMEARAKSTVAEAESTARARVEQADAKARQRVADADAKARQRVADADAKARKRVAAADAAAEKRVADAEKAAAEARKKVAALEKAAAAKVASADKQSSVTQRRLAAARKEAAEHERRAKEARAQASGAERRAALAEARAAEAEQRAQHAAAEANRLASESKGKGRRAEKIVLAAQERAAEAAKQAEAAKLEAQRVRKEADDDRARAKALLGEAKDALAKAEVDRDQAARARAEAEAALAEARKAAKKARGSKRKELDRAVAQAREAETAAKKRQKQAEGNVARLKKDHSELARALEDTQRRNAKLEEGLKSREQELADLRTRLAEAKGKYRALGGNVRKADVEVARASAARAKTARAMVAKEVDRLRAEAHADQADFESAQRALHAAKKSKAGKSKIRALQAEYETAQAAMSDSATALQTRSMRLAELSQAVALEYLELSQLEVMLATRKNQTAADKKEAKKAAAAVTKAQGELQRVEGDVGKARDRLEAIQAQVREAEKKLDATVAEVKQARSLKKKWAKERAAHGSSKVKDVRFEDAPTESRVIVQLDGPVEYDSRSLTPSMTMLELKGTDLPSKLERSLDTSSFKGPVSMISSFKEDDAVKILVAGNNQGKPKVSLDAKSGQLVWHFPRKKGRGKSEVVSFAGNKVSGFSTPPVNAARKSVGSRGKWRGERIDIELQDAPIKDVLLLFSDIGRVNIIAGKGVAGNVTMKLNSVPWDQALDIILRSLSLGMTQEGNVIRVATLSDLEEERRKAIEKAASEVQLRRLETRLVPLSYATVSEMMPKVQSVLSSRGTVTPDSRTNTLIIMDVAQNIALAEELINQLDSQTPQVLIEARIVEARTNWLRQLGIQWGFDFTMSPGTGNPTGLLFPNAVGIGGGSGSNQSNTNGLILPGAAANPNYAVDLPAPVGTGAGGAIGFSFGSISGNLNTNLRLSAAEDEGEVRIISAPKIVTMDNTQAQIEQGVQIPISQVSAQGVNTRYVNATLALQVTPHVTNEGAVMLDVSVQKNEADFINTGARGDPTILTKNAQSKMLITDGDTAVIGGIYTRNQSINRKKIPWIADIPIIGWFFKNKSEADTRTEVLIFLTPKIVNRSTSIGG